MGKGILSIDETERAGDARSSAFVELDIKRIRQDFPALHILGPKGALIYFDNAATSHKPRAVIEAMHRFYSEENSNVHRGVHRLSAAATEAYEGARKKIHRFINAHVSCEIVFTRGATEGINLVAQSYGRKHVGKGDEVLITGLEHHSNIVPWQILCEEKGATLRAVPITDDGEVLIDDFRGMLNARTRLVAISHVSNALGTINPVKEMTALAHKFGAAVLVDGAQAIPHMPVDVQDINCEFYVFSGHKMCGPMGIGVLYGKADFLNEMPPYQGGGDMILSVSLAKTTYNSLPYKFEAGTPNVAGVIGLGAAVDYLSSIAMNRIAGYELELLEYGTELLSGIEGLRIVGTARHKAAVLSFTMAEAHPHDIGQILDDEGIAIRAGHHCAQPVMERFGLPATARASLAFYNTRDELDALAAALLKVKEVFS